MLRITPFLAYFCLAWVSIASAAGLDVAPAYPAVADGKAQYSAFPLPTNQYEAVDTGLVSLLKSRIAKDPFNLAASIIFFLAILHTFAAGFFIKLAHKYEHLHDEQVKKRGVLDAAHPDGVHEVSFRGTLFHFLGEIEAVFGLWVLALAGAAIYFHSWHDFQLYLSKDRNFTEPLFVVIIMAVAASRPVLRFAETLMAKAASLGKGSPTAWWFSVLTIGPVLGSFITEPAAMTIAALLLAKRFYRHNPSPALAYGTLGLLFVSISIGGTFTNFAAPPVLMVAGPWKWSTAYMFEHFGWKALIAILVSTSLYFVFFRKALAQVTDAIDGVQDGKFTEVPWQERETPIPMWVTMVHLVFLLWTVYSAHYPVLFIGGFLFFLAFVIATRHHQNEVSLRGPILVGFFLGALVIHGGCQSWWIEPVIKAMSTQVLMLGATILTAFNDNAAITYLASQVPGISTAAKYAVVAGAVTGGGLTVIANAPNPAGQSILSKYFKDGVSPLGLALGAIIPTIIAYLCFALLPSGHAGEKEAGEAQAAPIHSSAGTP
jgi:Putative Na+/H+ antiporter